MNERDEDIERPVFDGPEQAFHWYLNRREQGEPVSLDDLRAEHPGWAADLDRLDADWAGLERVQQRLGLDIVSMGSLQLELLTQPSSVVGAWRSEATRQALQRLIAHASRQPRYERRGPIDEGGMGEILDVWDEDLRRGLAMKVMRADRFQELARSDRATFEHFLMRFLEEAQVTAQLNHPGIVPVHDVGLDSDGRVYFTMARVRGVDLRKALDRQRAGDFEWTRTRLLSVVQRVAETMAYAHARGVVHRDLKPANVMVGKFGEVYVMDWGLALLNAATSPREPIEGLGDVVTDRKVELDSDPDSPLASFGARQPGTIYYMPPEQAQGDGSHVGPLSDVYSLGALLYEVLSGRVPFAQKGASPTYEQIQDAIVGGRLEPLSKVATDVPAELVSITEKAMALDPADRYADMSAFADDVRAYLEGRVVQAHATGPVVELRKWITRNRFAAAAVIATLVALVGGSGSTAYVQAMGRAEQERLNGQLTERNQAITASRAREQATALLGSAELAWERGEWTTAIQRVDEARRAFAAVPPELRMLATPDWHETRMDLIEARCHLVANDHARARALLEQALEGEETPLEGSMQLLLAWLELGEWVVRRDDVALEDPLERVRRAQELQLTEADELVAGALFEHHSRDALEAYEAAASLDPRNYVANISRLQLLTLSGRLQEAEVVARICREFYPDDPAAEAMQFLRDRAAGVEVDEERKVDLAEHLGPSSWSSLEAIGEFLATVDEAGIAEAEAIEQPWPLTGGAAWLIVAYHSVGEGVRASLMEAADDISTSACLTPTVHHLGEFWNLLLDAGAVLSSVTRAEEQAAAYEKAHDLLSVALARHEEGWVSATTGFLLFVITNNEAHSDAYRVIESMAAARRTHSLFDHEWPAVAIELMTAGILARSPSQVHQHRALQSAREAAQEVTLRPGDVPKAVFKSLFGWWTGQSNLGADLATLDDLEAQQALLDLWAMIDAPSRDRRTMLARSQVNRGDWIDAIQTCDELLEEDSSNELISGLRDRAVREFRAWSEGLALD